MIDLKEIRERSARQDGVADSTVKQLLDHIAALERHSTALAEALDGYQECCGEDHPRPKFECLTCGDEETVLTAYREFLTK